MTGRGAPKSNAWKDRTKIQNSQQKRAEGSGLRGGSGSQLVNLSQAEEKFLAAKSRMQASVQKHLHDDYNSSSEEDELETDNILNSVLKNYSSLSDDSNVDLGRTQKFLEDAFQSGAAICLICIATVKRPDAIWSCTKCFCFFHVICIQRWAKDSVTHQKQVLEERQQAPPIWDKLSWACPKCRNNYSSTEIPKAYFCFCGNVEDPEFHPWLVPHSCGETCNKPLQPSCGHQCLLLCHPGPCPPCPKMVQSHCHCGKAAPRPQRCSNKHWSCGETCGKLLTCGKHTCDHLCHSGTCAPCPRQSTQKCLCQRNSAVRECAQPFWKCEQVCGKPLACGNHRCEVVCHSGACDQCALTQTRRCPCGKCEHVLPCDRDTPTCGDTCGKTLECGQHTCSLRCHTGPCGPCLERVVKTCRCGLHSNEVPCAKEYTCETKCKKKKDCNLHTCNRKCCDGSCPPCEKPCGKPLKCGKHKCQSICHHGPCYPCHLTDEIHCWCKATSTLVPCSINKKRFSCNKLCKIPPYCHHEKRKPHKCHSGLCPPCKQPCGATYDVCGHVCKDICHLPYLKEPNIPHKQRDKMVVEEVRGPCRPCSESIAVPCLGGHEMMAKPCHKAFHTSCGRKCGRLLACGNHVCDKECHTVLGADDDTVAGKTCEPCNRSCEVARPAGCPHACPHACHPPPCKPCTVMLRMPCHCSLVQLYVRCGDYVAATSQRRLQMLTCDNQCPKNYPCGHRCASTCHIGECPNAETCRQNVKVACKCKRIRKTFRCVAVRAGEAHVDCDQVCLANKEEELKKKELEKQKQLELEEKKNREELEKFQKKFQGRKKHKERRSYEVDDKKSFMAQYWPWLLASGGLTMAILAYYCL
ncbi:NF-X1-type zinc finger protein NFXL1 [Nilaparvata lugens]|uniref:NF-X1-type zinc finger protein NFXL1 n=1 Tax=Nilaparvata lugens TaxID=108931 RepID=UPI00193D2CE5|nr:NF-X1-type zinc finger protein NFXL1 [Nilaparvata lugens]XP_039286401.1 NF-X1-type zinc finger protein NFXL1 [Nilaparvata lugens]